MGAVQILAMIYCWRRSAASGLIGGVVLLMICGNGAAAQTVRDSAGGRIVTYAARAQPAQRWSIDQRPLVEVGGGNATGPSQFWLVAGVLTLPDGSFAVAEADSREIRVFDPRGRHLRTFGGRGSGPGEFTSLWRIWRAGNVLIAVDGQGRLHRFSIAGEYLGTTTPPLAAPGRRLRGHGVLHDGRLIASAPEQTEVSRSDRFTRFMNLVRSDATGTQPLGRFPAYEAVNRPNAAESAVVYGPTAQVAVLPNGYCVGYSADNVIRCFDADGAFRMQIVRRQGQGARVTEADRAVFFDGIDRANPGERGAQYRAQVRKTTVFAERFPPFGRLVASAVGELWVGPLVAADETLGTLNPSPPGPTTWSVYTLDGVWLSDVTLPARFRLMDAGRDHVAGITRDSDDIERVTVYRLRRGRSD